MPVVITEENYNQEVLEFPGLVVLDVYATWCGPCQQMEPIMVELEKEFGSRCRFAKLDLGHARDLAIKLNVMSVPTFLFVVNGVIEDRAIGSMSKQHMKDKVESYL
jgi:thioredoxin